MIRALLLGMLMLTSCNCDGQDDPVDRCIDFGHEVSECAELAKALCCCDEKDQSEEKEGKP